MPGSRPAACRARGPATRPAYCPTAGSSSWAGGARPRAACICPRSTFSTRSQIAGRRPRIFRRRGGASPLREVLRHFDQRVDLIGVGTDRSHDHVGAAGLGQLLEPLDDLVVGSEQVALLEVLV